MRNGAACARPEAVARHSCVTPTCNETGKSNTLSLPANPIRVDKIKTEPEGATGTFVSMGVTSEARWFAVHTLPRKESTAVLQLARQGFGTFLPLIPVPRHHARKRDTVLVALFPRYAFIRLDLARDRWRAVNSTQGVASLVMAHERPCPVPEGVVEDLSARVRSNGIVDLDDELRPGDEICIVDGPLAGGLGKLVRLEDKGRVEILLDLMRTHVRVKVARNMLESVC